MTGRLNFSRGGGKEIRTLAGAKPHYRFSRPTPSTAWVCLRRNGLNNTLLRPRDYYSTRAKARQNIALYFF